MNIRAFTERDLDACGRIAMQQWGDEIPEMPERMVPLIYQYLIRYYYVPGSEYNFAAEENGEVCGFFLAAPAGHVRTDAPEKWIAPQLADQNERDFFTSYKAYLDANRMEEEKLTRPDELVLLLLASIRRGAGRALFDAMNEKSRENGFRSQILWTDETCDYDYYFKRGFTRVANFPTPVPLCGKRFSTWIFRHELS